MRLGCSPNRFLSQESDEWNSLSCDVKLENSKTRWLWSVCTKGSIWSMMVTIIIVRCEYWFLMKQFKDSYSQLVETVVDCNWQPKLSWTAQRRCNLQTNSFIHVYITPIIQNCWTYIRLKILAYPSLHTVEQLCTLARPIWSTRHGQLRNAWKRHANQRHWDH